LDTDPITSRGAMKRSSRQSVKTLSPFYFLFIFCTFTPTITWTATYTM